MKEERRHSFQIDLFVSVFAIFLVGVVAFCLYQHSREKAYKVDLMHSKLQMFNYEMANALGSKITDSTSFANYVQLHSIDGLRVTLIDQQGHVLRDSEHPDVALMPNHLDRKEVEEAIKHGNGYDIKRSSESTHQIYFYSATWINGYIIRSAAPYSAQLAESLKANNSYLIFALLSTLLLGFAMYRAVRRIGRHVEYLKEFAQKAEQGKEIDVDLERRLPDDELGEISHTVIALYWKLRHSEEDKVRLKHQLTQNAAHELKTPVASIQGFLETILDHPEMDQEQQRHFLDRCFEQSKRMSRLLQDMSALSRLDNMSETGTRAESEKIDLRQTIDTVLADTALQLQEKGMTPELSLPEKIEIQGDPGLVYGIFRNLADNALAYAEGATKLAISCREEESQYEFEVSDNGIGVEPQHLSKLFDRFYRVDKGRSRKMGGTGLGLAIVKNSILLHGGSVRAENTPGGGLTIHFSLSKN